MTFVPELMTVDTLFRQMTEQRHHIAIVQDEFGSTVGLVTLEEVVETLVGVEIVDEKGKVADLQNSPAAYGSNAPKQWVSRQT